MGFHIKMVFKNFGNIVISKKGYKQFSVLGQHLLCKAND